MILFHLMGIIYLIKKKDTIAKPTFPIGVLTGGEISVPDLIKLDSNAWMFFEGICTSYKCIL